MLAASAGRPVTGHLGLVTRATSFPSPFRTLICSGTHPSHQNIYTPTLLRPAGTQRLDVDVRDGGYRDSLRTMISGQAPASTVARA